VYIVRAELSVTIVNFVIVPLYLLYLRYKHGSVKSVGLSIIACLKP